MKFLDTNAILRYLTRDDEGKAEAYHKFLQRVQMGEQGLFTCESIIAEVIYALSSPRQYRLSHQEIREWLCIQSCPIFPSFREQDSGNSQYGSANRTIP